MSSDATVCILTFNGEEFLDDLLRAVCNQETRRSYDVLVIDSGSTDSTLDICALYDEVRVHTIDNSEFGHGKTRNLAVELANSEYVLFLTQDAVPASSHWLDAMLEPFELFDTVSCVFGKQVPRPDCVTIVKREVSSLFSRLGDDASISIQRISPLTEAKEIANMFFSDVNSAVKKSCMLEIPFRDVSYAEDQALAIDHLTRGWMKAYAPWGSFPLTRLSATKILQP